MSKTGVSTFWQAQSDHWLESDFKNGLQDSSTTNQLATSQSQPSLPFYLYFLVIWTLTIYVCPCMSKRGHTHVCTCTCLPCCLRQSLTSLQFPKKAGWLASELTVSASTAMGLWVMAAWFTELGHQGGVASTSWAKAISRQSLRADLIMRHLFHTTTALPFLLYIVNVN